MSEVDMSKYELIPTAEALEYTKQQLAGFDETLNSLCVEAQRDTLQTAFQLAVATTDGSSIPETERNMVCAYFSKIF